MSTIEEVRFDRKLLDLIDSIEMAWEDDIPVPLEELSYSALIALPETL